jgi:ubiquinone/menaquinone biosynthesis C-methylase UbiE
VRIDGTVIVVPDAIFAHPRLAAIYDAFDGERHDLGPYVRIIDELGAHHVIDVGCGTGTLAVVLARGGRTVTAVDPARASLEIAKTKPWAASVTWIQGDATQLPPLQADAAVMTGNVAQVFLTDQAWSDTLGSVRKALREGGFLAFESRRPERRAWEEWATSKEVERLDVPGVGRVERRREITRIALPYVSFRETYTFDSDAQVLTSESTLRFRSREEIERSLAESGFSSVEVREAPDRVGREFVFVTQRAPVTTAR